MLFADIIGQKEIGRRLRENAMQGRVSHAQLFTGRSGYGALPLALAYVQYLNCENRTADDSCGKCPSCMQMAQIAHPDLHIVMPVNKQGKKSGEVVLSDSFLPLLRQELTHSRGYLSSQRWYEALNLGKTLKGVISAKEADEVVRKLSFKSYGSRYKAMIVWLPEMMNEQAANKILKILEEPWERTLFILVSEQPALLLKTILSRTQEVAVPPIDSESLAQYAMQQGVNDTAKVRAAARLCAGDLEQLQQIIGGARNESSEQCFELFCDLMRLSYNDKHLELVGWAERVGSLNRDAQLEMLKESARLLREAFMIHAGVRDISYLWGKEQDFCNKFAPFIGSQNIEILISEIETATAQLRQNANATILFTHFALVVSKQINRLK